MDSPTNASPDRSASPELPQVVERSKQTSQVMTGVLLIVVGGIFLADRLGDAYDWNLSFRRLWPIILIVAGLGMQFSHRDSEIITTNAADGTVRREVRRRRESGNGGLFLMLVGVLMLAHMNRWLMLRDSWPLFIVAGGLSLMFSRGNDRSSRRERR